MPCICAFCQCPLASWHLVVRTSPRTPISLHVCWYDPDGADCASPALAANIRNITVPIAKFAILFMLLLPSGPFSCLTRTFPDVDLDSPQRNPVVIEGSAARCWRWQHSV